MNESVSVIEVKTKCHDSDLLISQALVLKSKNGIIPEWLSKAKEHFHLVCSECGAVSGILIKNDALVNVSFIKTECSCGCGDTRLITACCRSTKVNLYADTEKKIYFLKCNKCKKEIESTIITFKDLGE